MIKLLIISQPRTGSSWLTTLLGHKQGHRLLVEPIIPACIDYFMKPNEQSNVIKEYHIQNNLITVLDDLFNSEYPDKQYGVDYPKLATDLSGFKIMIHQIKALPSPDIFIRYLERNNVKILVNYRYNIGAQYVSEIIAKKTKQLAAFGETEPVTAVVQINKKDMQSRLTEIVEEKKYLAKLLQGADLDCKTLFYEDYKDNIANLIPITIWLMGKQFDLHSTHKKQNPEDIREVVSNYDDYLEVLASFNQ